MNIRVFSILLLVITGFSFSLTNEILIDFNEFGNFQTSTNNELYIRNNEAWKVHLNSSMNHLDNSRLSYTKNVTCNFSALDDNYSIGALDKGYILGFRANFPNQNWNAVIDIEPRFKIPFFGGEDGQLFRNKGMLGNVGPIIGIRAWVRGGNYPFGVHLQLRNQRKEVRSFFLGYIDFSGWKVLEFKNDNFGNEVIHFFKEKQVEYPQNVNQWVFDSITINKSGEFGPNGDFVGYIGWITMQYVPYDTVIPADLKQEEIWNLFKIEHNKEEAFKALIQRATSEQELLDKKKLLDKRE